MAIASPSLAGETTFGFSPGLSWKGLCSRLAAVLAGKEKRGKPSSRGLAARQDTWASSLQSLKMVGGSPGQLEWWQHRSQGVESEG